jgi:alanyl-tRNA synthetase
MTEKRYLQDSYLKDCTAHIIQTVQVKDKVGIILDRTIFYATSGGQPHDLGIINDVAVVDVFENKDHQIVHVVEKPIQGNQVNCALNWERRLDHMQQHTGQHILSQAFIQIIGANTLAFHLGDQSATIDVDKPDLNTATIHQVEELCNQIIFENRKIIVHEVDYNELHRYPTRKQPQVEGSIRIIEIKDFDHSPCGGTHCARTGETGLLKIWRHENYKGGTRIHFKCGFRALRDYQSKTEILKQLSNTMSTAETDLATNIIKLKDELKTVRRERTRFSKALMEYEADKLISESTSDEGIFLITKAFQDRDMKALGMLANLIIEKSSRTVLLFGTSTRTKAQLLFQCTADLSFDMGELMQNACIIIDGRGGGQAHKAQGGGPATDKIKLALGTAEKELKAAL